MSIFAALAAPFPHAAVHWRAQAVTGDGSKALALAYIDARDVMDRLDTAVGPANWRDSYEETAKGRLLCTLEIRVDGEWIAKSDGAGNTDVEGEKGAISDALKRAAVKWGIGRYLYDLKDVWAPCESYKQGDKFKWKKWANGSDAAFARALDALAKPVEAAPMPTGPISDETRDWLAGKIDSTSKTVGDFCTAFGVITLKAITYEQLDEAKAWVRANRKAA